MKSRLRTLPLLVALGALVVAVLLDFQPIVVGTTLLVGWFGYVTRTLPDVRVHWPAVGMALAALVLVLVLGHGFAGWLYRETTGGRRWRKRWTLASAGVVVLMFVCGTAAVGVAHQSAWLARSDRLFEYRGRERANRVKCASNLRQLDHAIRIYASRNGGKFPDAPEDLVLSMDVTADLYVCPASNTDRVPATSPAEQHRQLRLHRHNSYVYHGRGLTTATVHGDRPIACEPAVNHRGEGMNILFGDGRVEWVSLEVAERIMAAVAG